MKKVFKSKKKNAHKFLKKITIFCIAFIVIYTAIEMYFNYKLGVEISPTLTGCVYTFFGTELAACAFIRIFDRESAAEEIIE